MKTTQVLFICLTVLLAICLADEMCLKGPHHKESPGPEDDGYVECFSWKQNTCCRANVTHEIQNHQSKNLYNYHWDRCGDLPAECEEFIKDEECFYQCEPNLIRWQNPTDEDAIKGVPICASYCNSWFDACKNASTCVVDWLAGFNYSNPTGENHCPTDSECKTFEEVYKNGEGLCNTMWGKAFKYEASNENCMVMKFNGSHPNPNANVSPATSQATFVARSLFYVVLSVAVVIFYFNF